MRILKIILLATGFFGLIYFGAFLIRKFRIVNEVTAIQSTHFKINYSGILKNEAENIATSLEENFSRIRKELNDPDHERIQVFVHSTQQDFNDATGLKNSHANGTSRGPKIFHIMYQTWFNSILPANMEKVAVHEFTHCVQLNILIADSKTRYGDVSDKEFERRFETEFAEKYPQWFWEALSDYEANIVNKVSVNFAMRKRPTLKQLNTSNQIYNVGYTLINYMAATWGKDKLPAFIKSYGDFEKVLNISEHEFEEGWYKFVEANY